MTRSLISLILLGLLTQSSLALIAKVENHRSTYNSPGLSPKAVQDRDLISDHEAEKLGLHDAIDFHSLHTITDARAQRN